MNPLIESSPKQLPRVLTILTWHCPGYSQPYDTRQGPRPIVLLWTANIFSVGRGTGFVFRRSNRHFDFCSIFQVLQVDSFYQLYTPLLSLCFIYYVFFSSLTKKKRKTKAYGWLKCSVIRTHECVFARMSNSFVYYFTRVFLSRFSFGLDVFFLIC